MSPHDQQSAAYDGFAATFAAEAAVSAYNAFYDRPTVLNLIGDVRGRRVLDAGCGPGLYLTELTARGAHTIGIDQSANMIACARERLGPDAQLRQHDLNEPLDWLAAGNVDLVLLALVLHYLRDRVAVLRELHRILAPHGRVVISTSHPTADWLADGGGYFDARHVRQQWSGGMVHRFWRQPLGAWCAEFTAAGFVIEQLVEHQPDAAMAGHHPAEHATLSREPGFIAFRLAKAPIEPACPAPTGGPRHA
jgi:SAM-dependent methyltransferase